MMSLALLHGGTGICWLELQQLLQVLPFIGPMVLVLINWLRRRR